MSMNGTTSTGVDTRDRRDGTTAALARAGAPAVVVTDELRARYGSGDTEERIAVLGVLDDIAAERPAPDLVRDVGVELVRDALRSNDPRLVAAAMGAFAGRHLGDHDWRHGVVKLVFMGVPLAGVARLDERADDELARMAEDLAEEREAAGRPVPDDLRALLRPSVGVAPGAAAPDRPDPESADATGDAPGSTRPEGR
ncbi:EboA domain-containing protein [Agromyces sp. ZXT2-3]|uniref:EboA domain-containing protein n=1 Tax=Agromyces sp. ZXT2-3 TaxID=3461152 RepID=UPI0040552A8A